MNITKMIAQLRLCILARYIVDISEDQLDLMLTEKVDSQQIQDWYEKFYRDIFNSKNGYPLYAVHKIPYTEYFISDIVKRLQINSSEKGKSTACLSHDLDNLSGSLALTLKSLISERKFRPFSKRYEFITSIRHLLELDAKYSKRNKSASTLFIPMPYRSANIITRIKQLIVDPTYNASHPLFPQLRDLINEFETSVGIHGSFFSITEQFFDKEKHNLSKAISKDIKFSRQHWLNLPKADSLDYLKSNQIIMDSSIGWNGDCGFRGGMARPFQLLLNNNQHFWVLPLIIMDGPLLLDSGLDKDGAFDLAKNMLKIVDDLKGCVSINWHDRAAHPDYSWVDVYEQILSFLQSLEFNFLNIEEIYNIYAA